MAKFEINLFLSKEKYYDFCSHSLQVISHLSELIAQGDKPNLCYLHKLVI
jgi:hypothetical protein